MVLYNIKKYDESIKQLEKAKLLSPTSFDPTKFISIFIHLKSPCKY